MIIIKEALEQAGYSSESVYDGLTAIELLREKNYELVH